MHIRFGNYCTQIIFGYVFIFSYDNISYIQPFTVLLQYIMGCIGYLFFILTPYSKKLIQIHEIKRNSRNINTIYVIYYLQNIQFSKIEYYYCTVKPKLCTVYKKQYCNRQPCKTAIAFSFCVSFRCYQIDGVLL